MDTLHKGDDDDDDDDDDNNNNNKEKGNRNKKKKERRLLEVRLFKWTNTADMQFTIVLKTNPTQF